jgi:hypothetical protein
MISQTSLLELELHDKVQVKKGWPFLAKSSEGWVNDQPDLLRLELNKVQVKKVRASEAGT